jgi:hypothetical protein
MALTQPDHRVLCLRIGPLLISAFLLHPAMLGVDQAAVTSDETRGTAVTRGGATAFGRLLCTRTW